MIESREGRYGSSPGRLRAEQKWLRAVRVLEHKCMLKCMYVHSGSFANANHVTTDAQPRASYPAMDIMCLLPITTTTTMTQMHLDVNVFPTPMTNITDSVANTCDEEMIESKLLSQIWSGMCRTKSKMQKNKANCNRAVIYGESVQH